MSEINTDQDTADVQSAEDLFDVLDMIGFQEADTAIAIIEKRDLTIRAKDKATIAKLRESLNKVLNTTERCHDCWGCSASDDDKLFVEQTLTETAPNDEQ